MAHNLRLRPANPADIVALMAIDQENPTAAHWSRDQYNDLFSPSSLGSTVGSTERLVLVAEDPGDGGPGASTEKNSVVAFLVAHRVEAEWELENIVVAPDAQRKGLGTRLLEELINQVRAKHGKNIFLEVRESNQRARSFYRKANFKETGVRKGYYSGPKEGAVLYSLTFP